MTHYRDHGAIGALLDEYERAVDELREVIAEISDEELVQIVDPTTTDSDCRSVQTILTHVIRAGYCYVIYMRNSLGEDLDFVERELLPTVADYERELKKMFQYSVDFFTDYPNVPLETFDPAQKILVRWGQRYDVEQLFEHAIVHILRHRRQIERFLLRLRT